MSRALLRRYGGGRETGLVGATLPRAGWLSALPAVVTSWTFDPSSPRKVAHYDFAGTDGADWHSTWTTGLNPTNPGGSVTVQGNQGRMVTGNTGGYAGANNVSRRLSSGAIPNLRQVRTTGLVTFDSSECYVNVLVRASDSAMDGQDAYSLVLNGPGSGLNRIDVQRIVSFSGTTIGTAPVTISAGVQYRYVFEVSDFQLRAKLWPAAQAEPVAWMVNVFDTARQWSGAGYSGIKVGCGSAAVSSAVHFDDVTYWDLTLVPNLANLGARATLGVSSTGVPSGGGVDSRAVTASVTLGLAPRAVVAKRANAAGSLRLGATATVAARKASTAAVQATVGVLATAVARKVGASSARAALGIGASATARKVATPAARAAVGVVTLPTVRKVATTTGRSSVGLAATASSRKVAPASALATVGLAPTSAVRKRATVAVFSRTGLTATAAVVRRALAGGLSALGLASTATVTTGSGVPVAGRACLGLTARVTARKVVPASSRGTVGACSSTTARKVARPALTSVVGLSARAGGVKVSPAVARAAVGLSGRVSLVAPHFVTGRVALGATATAAARKRTLASAKASVGIVERATARHRAPAAGRAVVGLASVVVVRKRALTTGRTVVGAPLHVAVYYTHLEWTRGTASVAARDAARASLSAHPGAATATVPRGAPGTSSGRRGASTAVLSARRVSEVSCG